MLCSWTLDHYIMLCREVWCERLLMSSFDAMFQKYVQACIRLPCLNLILCHLVLPFFLCTRSNMDLLFVLKIWLHEHLAIIHRPSDVSRYTAGSFPTRKRSIIFSSRAEWATFLRGRFVLRHRIAWWHLRSMVGGNHRVSHMRLLGLTRATFFLPHRVRRQYGLAQRIPDKDDSPPEDHDLSSRFIEGWKEYWSKGVRWTVPRVKESAHTTDYFREWITCHDAGKRSYLRGLEHEASFGHPTPTPGKRSHRRGLEHESSFGHPTPPPGIVIRERGEEPPSRREEREEKGKGKEKAKGKEKMKDDNKPSKKWRREDGSSSGK